MPKIAIVLLVAGLLAGATECQDGHVPHAASLTAQQGAAGMGAIEKPKHGCDDEEKGEHEDGKIDECMAPDEKHCIDEHGKDRKGRDEHCKDRNHGKGRGHHQGKHGDKHDRDEKDACETDCDRYQSAWARWLCRIDERRHHRDGDRHHHECERDGKDRDGKDEQTKDDGNDKQPKDDGKHDGKDKQPKDDVEDKDGKLDPRLVLH